MSALTGFANGFALSGALIVAIGAQNLFVLRQGLRRKHVGAVVAFCALSDFLLMMAGVSGIGAMLRAIPGLAPGLTLGGAAFLAWYGVAAARRAAVPARLVTQSGDGGGALGRVLRLAAAFTFLNPHVYLDTVLLMGTIAHAQPAGGRVVFLAGAVAASSGWFVSLGYGARFLAPVFARPGAWRVLDAAIAAIMLALAGMLVLRLGARWFWGAPISFR